MHSFDKQPYEWAYRTNILKEHQVRVQVRVDVPFVLRGQFALPEKAHL